MIKTFEQYNNVDPYGEEIWNKKDINYRNFDQGEDLFEWMEEIGIEDKDIQFLKRNLTVYVRLLKNGLMDLSIQQFSRVVIPYLKNLKDEYDFKKEEDFLNFMGVVALNGLK